MDKKNQIVVSVVIPVFNGASRIESCLNSLLSQNFNEEYEIIIVDDGSSDNLKDVISGYPDVSYVFQANAGPGVARNHGASLAKGEFLLFTDDDCVPVSNWISLMVTGLRSGNQISGVKGAYLTNQDSLVSRFVQLEYEDKYDVMKKFEYIDFIDTYSAGFKKSIFMEFGGYDSQYTTACAEDVDLSYRMYEKGYKMLFIPQAIVYHLHPSSLWAYLKKKFKFAYWRVLAVKNSPSKVIRDTHTPQIMKVQLLIAPFILISCLIWLVFDYGEVFAYGLSLAFMLLSLPFLLKSIMRDTKVALISPFLLFMRSCSQFLGLLSGAIYFLRFK